jgi:hypothetical protein
MAIKCWHCKESHETVAEVRECSGVDTGAVKVMERTNLTKNQKRYLNDLLHQLSLVLDGDVTPDNIGYETGQPLLTALVAARRNMAMGKAFAIPAGTKRMANAHRGQSRERTATQREMPDVPEGHYAVPSLTGNNDLDFFRVDRPDKGDYVGRTFVKRVIGGHPDASVRGKQAVAALEAILEFGPEDAGILYGSTLGKCRRCNRHLTDELSRNLGIGPECRSK